MTMSRKRSRPFPTDTLPPAISLKLAPGESWSRALSTGQAAAIIGKTPDALRAMLRARAAGAAEVTFDGIWGVRVGKHWRVRLDRRWVASGASPNVLSTTDPL